MKKFLIFCIIGFLFDQAQGVDQTLEEKTIGADVTDAVVRKISRTGIFSLDQGFFRRLAFAETAFGEDPKTYRDGYFGGIWQVDEEYFQLTKGLPEDIYEQIRKFWNIDWQAVRWTDLIKPFYSGLAFKLYMEHLSNQGIDVRGTIENQAEFWVTNYRKTGPPATVDFFKSAIRRLESDGGPVCEGMMDICIILDGSGSVGPEDFNKSKTFVVDLVRTFSSDTSRVAFLTYGDNAYEIFDFQHSLTNVEMEEAILAAPYPNENTNTPAALLMARDFYSRINKRNGVPQIVTTFTDGLHNRGNLPTAVAAIKEAGLTSFGVGITDAPEYPELLQIALLVPSRVFSVTNFDALAEFIYQMNSATCDIPQEPELGTNQTGSLNSGERRYFQYTIPVDGLHLYIESTGEMIGWYSYTDSNPNSAVYDGDIKVGVSFFIPFQFRKFQEEEANVVYVTLQANSENSGTDYLIIADKEIVIVTGGTTPETTTPEATTPEATTPVATTTTIGSTTSEEPLTTESIATSFKLSFIHVVGCIMFILYFK